MLDKETMARHTVAAIVQAMANHEPEHSDYSGYYGCQYCGAERREEPPYNMDDASWRAWITHSADCPVMQARALLATERPDAGEE